MGAWGIGILQDDVADDVLIAFEDALAESLTPVDAVQCVHEDPPWPIHGYCDEDDAATTYMALAAIQLQHGILTPEIRDKALEAATSHWAIGRFEWDGAPEERVTARKELLRRFSDFLERGSCALEDLEQVTYPKEFSLW